MYQPIAFASSSTGDLTGFAKTLAEQSETVSVTMDDGFNFSDTSSFKVLQQIEPEEVLDCVDDIIAYHKHYDLVLAWNKRVLEACPNARLHLHGKCTWMERSYKPWLDTGSPMALECDASKKQFKASFLTSDKAFTSGHVIRQKIYEILPDSIGDLRIHKHKSPPRIPDKREILHEYQFTITPQNASQDNWFDDKIVDAIVAKTIPVYWGCPNIGEHFNLDGIIHFKTVEEMMERLLSLTPDYYEKHYPAVQENFHRAMKMVNLWHLLDTEITEGIERRKQGGWRHEEVPQGHVGSRRLRRH